jgi:hypothetical protein
MLSPKGARQRRWPLAASFATHLGFAPARRIEREEMERIKAEIRGLSETLG